MDVTKDDILASASVTAVADPATSESEGLIGCAETGTTMVRHAVAQATANARPNVVTDTPVSRWCPRLASPQMRTFSQVSSVDFQKPTTKP